MALFAIMLLVFATLHDRVAFRVAALLLGLGAFVYSPLLAVPSMVPIGRHAMP